MRNLLRFALKNPVTISMIVFAILLLGKISYDRLSVDLLPDMNTPRLFVELEAGERPPEEIEKMFIENIESMAIRQSDVVQVSSVIRAGSARVTVEYLQNKDMDEAFLDLQKAMAPLSQNPDIESINITQHDPNTAPVMLIAMSHQSITDMAELRKMADSYIRNELIRLEGIAEVSLSGEERQVLTIETDPYTLRAFGITMEEIASRIESNNQSISGGRVSEMGLQYLVKSSSLFHSEADFENLIISYKPVEAASGGSGNGGQAPLFLREVATVKFENARPDNIVRINGERCIGLSVYKETQFNTVKAVELITAQLETIRQALPGYRFQVISNQGIFIRQAIGEVINSALLGMLLAVLVLFFFLRRVGTTLIVSLSIPISIIATFTMMYFNGLTLNVMTLSGLALGAGMLIDNVIVVIESIFRNREQGLERREAIINGTTEVAGAVIASTVTTIVVFIPIVYLHGASGELFKDLAWTVTFALLSSLFVALMVIPVLYDRLTGRENDRGETESVQFRKYSDYLRKFLGYRWWVIGGSAALLIISILLIPFVGTEFLPRTEGRDFTISVKLPEGTRLERTDAVVSNLEYLLHQISGDSLAVIYSHIGKGSSDNAVFEGEHTAMVKVILSDESQLLPAELIARFAEATASIEGLELTFKQDNHSLGTFLGEAEAPIVVEVKGEDLEEIAFLTEDVLLRMASVEGIYNVRSSMADGAPELNININRTMAGIHNISANTLVQQLEQQLQGHDVGKMDYKGEMRDIVIKVPDITRRELGELVIRNGNQEFRLNEIATITHSQAPKEIYRRNQNRINKIVADMDAGRSLDKMAREIRTAVADIGLSPGYSITVTGEEEKRAESMQSLLFALMLSVVLVYMVLASQYESLLHPFTILLTTPFGLVGALLFFLITRTPLNVMGAMGIIMLAGIAINNSILLVGRINQLKRTVGLTEAIVQAGQQRIRPIIMTTLTTILVLLPMTFDFGEGAAMRSSMAVAVIGGLVTSTLMSLVVIPCVYYLFEQMKERVKKLRSN
ncbi:MULTISPECIES: efflux RND transporter permease subunit [Petrimonas]|jgi:HAE1 family hydrophobic/amphiphilic exporter-1|uniref:Nodulation protein NolG n=1 Tax=Petrimonas mucosa TaxID=1642646 RepID=A0A1G4G4G8_9BACT|nr:MULTISPECIES: efflux RND transporter permease subunit [Petrimonas]MDD3560724.1 efflux RND transporter permease subunit [Petrimonas mucosa]SCM55812.1 Nodulation protein NolG [Petrimonas mucosa]HHT30503.1 efflux RND transporter permease subunit [Petrimonas mucosa]